MIMASFQGFKGIAILSNCCEAYSNDSKIRQYVIEY